MSKAGFVACGVVSGILTTAMSAWFAGGAVFHWMANDEPDAVFALGGLAMVAAAVGGIVSLVACILRLVHGGPDERDLRRWLAYMAIGGVLVLLAVFGDRNSVDDPVWPLYVATGLSLIAVPGFVSLCILTGMRRQR